MDDTAYLADAIRQFQQLRQLADRALAQVDDAGFFATIGPESNSLAVLVAHLAGNMRSRWTDFLTTDGEKPDRQRDAEFDLPPTVTRPDLERLWDEGWACLFGALRALGPGDLARTVTIRGEPMSVLQAIQRQLVHYAQHVGQVVLLAKHAAGPAWQTLSIPRRTPSR